MNKKISIIREQGAYYPDKRTLFRPSNLYPENPFKDAVSMDENMVYDMVRKAFYGFGLDTKHYGLAMWNPLKEYVKPNDTVLIKPNLVYHGNGENGTDCLYTHPSVVAAVIDYVIIAQKHTGRIIVADAPLQECRFDLLVDESGYREMIEFYQNRDINIDLVDMRNSCTQIIDGVHFPQNDVENKNKGVQIDLGNESAFSRMDEKKIKSLRVTNFDPRILQAHHTVNRHEYLIAQEVIEADVVINIPKPKTHKKAGITAALKNLVGINASKEYLPHHTNGCVEEGGDAYLHQDNKLNDANKLLDKKNLAIAEKQYEMAKYFVNEFNSVMSCGSKNERYWEGSWYGNDTIWRTISDLNKILYYADKSGQLKNSVQRKVLIVSDMVVAGHREGPLAPSPIHMGAVAVADHPVIHDRAVCSLMGFDYEKIPSIKATELERGMYSISSNGEVQIISNWNEWSGASLQDIREKYSFDFIPTKGWEIVLGNKVKEAFAENIESEHKKIIIFGAGSVGIDFALYLMEKYHDIKIAGFYDNNPDLWGVEMVNGLYCMKPEIKGQDYMCVVAVRKMYIDALKLQAKQLGFEKVLCWSEE